MKIVPILLICTGLTLGAYPKFKPQPFDMINVRFCPLTSNTEENISELTRRGKKIKARDFTPQDEAQRLLYEEYCRKGNVMLKSYWEEKQTAIDLSVSPSSLLTKTVVNQQKLQDIILYGSSILLISLGYIYQKKYYTTKSKLIFSKIKQIENNVILTANNGNRARRYNTGIDNQEWDTKEEVAGLISREALLARQMKQALFAEEEFKVHLLSLGLEQSEAQKVIAQNNLDKVRAEKETAKILKTPHEEVSSSSSPDVKLKNALVDALKSHEDGWLWTIISSIKPIFLYGDAGTGKTNTAVTFGLIRHHCLDIPVFRIADRHLNGENFDLWQLLEAKISHDNDSSILEAIEDSLERRLIRIAERPSKGEQFLLDEFTQLVKMNKEVIEQFVASTYSDCRKAKEYFIGVTHNLTNAAFGDGTKEMRQGGFIIKKFTLDGFKPIKRVVIQTGLKDSVGNDLTDVEKTMPVWLRAETIYGHFNGERIDF
jgi:hypothetical protein